MKRNKRIKIILFLLLGVSVVIYIANVLYHAINELSDNPITFEKKEPIDYISLFNPEVQKDLVFQYGSSFKLRNTIAHLIYNKKYDVELTKITVKPNFQIKTDIIETYDEPKGFPPQTITSYNGNDLATNYNGNSTDTVSKIHLSLYGDSTRISIKNDSIACYNSDLKSAHVQYKSEGVYEISVDVKKNFYFFHAKKPVTIMLKKRNDYLYFIILSDRTGNTKLDPYLLRKLTQID
jgi:hypothetical protein